MRYLFCADLTYLCRYRELTTRPRSDGSASLEVTETVLTQGAVAQKIRLQGVVASENRPVKQEPIRFFVTGVFKAVGKSGKGISCPLTNLSQHETCK